MTRHRGATTGPTDGDGALADTPRPARTSTLRRTLMDAVARALRDAAFYPVGEFAAPTAEQQRCGTITPEWTHVGRSINWRNCR